MAATKLNTFSGLIPRLPESLLPESAATIAQNCDFSYGELRNTKSPFELREMADIVRSIYSDDGLTFFTWNDDVQAVRSPIVGDTFTRMYYTTTADGMRVANRMTTSLNGGAPATSYKVGVPRPTTKPVLKVDQKGNVSLDGATFAFKFHYEHAGVKYQEQDITATVVDPESPVPSEWAITIPMLNGGFDSTAEGFKSIGYITTYMVGSEIGDVPAELFHPFEKTEYAIIESPTAITVNGVYIDGVSKLRDAAGGDHPLDNLFSIGVYSYLREVSSTSVAGTPQEAFAVIRMIATKTETEAELLDIYTKNSAFNEAGLYYTLLLARVEDAERDYTIKLTSSIPESDKETRAYVYTYVNTYGEESPPSDPELIDSTPIVPVKATVTKDTITGYAPIKEIRLYRTASGSTIANYFYVGSVSVLAATEAEFIDDVRATMLAEELSSNDYYPPVAGLTGLMSLPNGILCAWKGNELHFSEAYKPWAWPPQYVKALPCAIMGGIAHGSGAVITTTQTPFIVSGVSPDSMTASQLNVDQAGVSNRSIAVVNGSVVYASNDGIVAVSGGTGTLAGSQRFFTRDVWRSRCANALGSLCFAVWDGRMIAYSSTNSFPAFMIRFDEAEGTMTDLPDLQAICSFTSKLSDQLYTANGRKVYQFNGGTDLPAMWQSREVVMPKPTNYGFAQAVCVGSWNVSFFADDILRHTQAVTTGTTSFRLPGGFKSDRWKVRITGSGRFRELRIANTASELAGV